MIPTHNRRDIINYRKEKALALLDEVKMLIDLKFANSAINRMYYACYHAVSALMLRHEIIVKSHKGLRQMFGSNFVRTGIIPSEDARIFARIYDKRQSSDYDDFYDISIEDVRKLYPQIKNFVNLILSLIDNK